MIRRPPRSTLFSLHDALPICAPLRGGGDDLRRRPPHRLHQLERREPALPAVSLPLLAHPSRRLPAPRRVRSEEHTSELQSRSDLVCRLLLEKKKKKIDIIV